LRGIMMTALPVAGRAARDNGALRADDLASGRPSPSSLDPCVTHFKLGLSITNAAASSLFLPARVVWSVAGKDKSLTAERCAEHPVSCGVDG
jgi:hypothetical protein